MDRTFAEVAEGVRAAIAVYTLVTPRDDEEASAVSDVVFLRQGSGGRKVEIVGRYEDVLHRDGTSWRFHRHVANFVT